MEFALQRIEGCTPRRGQQALLTGLNINTTLTGLRELMVARLQAHVFSPKGFAPIDQGLSESGLAQLLVDKAAAAIDSDCVISVTFIRKAAEQ
ncbi:MAG: hypothetical protein Q7T81_17210 [Pseudolabrys sp.]|nr:hypothetical protein [Pseudolabrys sp.]